MHLFTRLRQLAYRSHNALADAAGLTRSSLSRYFGRNIKMPMEAVLSIAKVSQRSPDWLIGKLELVPMQMREGNAPIRRQSTNQR